MLPLEKKVQQLIASRKLLPSGHTVVVAVSGGADSMALLHILARLHPFHRCPLVAAWIDHGLRPAESRTEHALVRQSSRKLDIPFACRVVDTRALQVRHRLSLEEAARELRYQALREIASLHQPAVIGVGHTANDQVEEMLIRLIRGSGRKGLSGMRMRSNDILRPLLTTSRAEILAYLREKGIGFCHDSSNDDPRFLRNRVRQQLLPLLETAFDARVCGSLLKCADNLAEDESLLEDLTSRAWQQTITWNSKKPACILHRKPFQGFHAALQRRLCEQLLWKLGVRASYQHILAIREMGISGTTGKELHLPGGLRLLVNRDTLLIDYPSGRQAGEK